MFIYTVSPIDTIIGGNVNVAPSAILCESPAITSPFKYMLLPMVDEMPLLVIVKLNVVVPIGEPVELNVNTFDVGVNTGVLVKPSILVTVALAEAHCWSNVK